jgi:hypothetical protein
LYIIIFAITELAGIHALALTRLSLEPKGAAGQPRADSFEASQVQKPLDVLTNHFAEPLFQRQFAQQMRDCRKFTDCDEFVIVLEILARAVLVPVAIIPCFDLFARGARTEGRAGRSTRRSRSSIATSKPASIERFALAGHAA